MIKCNGKGCVYNTEGICHRPEPPGIRNCTSISPMDGLPDKGPVQEVWWCWYPSCKYWRRLKPAKNRYRGYCDKEDITREYPDGCVSYDKM